MNPQWLTLQLTVYSLQVIGSDEEDVGMSNGLSGVHEQISIGYLALTDDFLQRLPVIILLFNRPLYH